MSIAPGAVGSSTGGLPRGPPRGRPRTAPRSGRARCGSCRRSPRPPRSPRSGRRGHRRHAIGSGLALVAFAAGLVERGAAVAERDVIVERSLSASSASWSGTASGSTSASTGSVGPRGGRNLTWTPWGKVVRGSRVPLAVRCIGMLPEIPRVGEAQRFEVDRGHLAGLHVEVGLLDRPADRVDHRGDRLGHRN